MAKAGINFEEERLSYCITLYFRLGFFIPDPDSDSQHPFRPPQLFTFFHRACIFWVVSLS